mgnify:CR=1 FL=1
MDINQKKNLICNILAFNVFRDILSKAPMAALLKFLNCDGDICGKSALYGEFVASLAEYNNSLSEFLRISVCESENRYIVLRSQGKEIPPSLEENCKKELAVLTSLTRLKSAEICDFPENIYVPQFENSYIDFEKMYSERALNLSSYGYGIFATSKMFRVSDGEICPIDFADDISLDDFVGYEAERRQVYDNIEALTQGRPALNTLLCGDAGTGKSSTVKACANHFFNNGVRLIELRKDQLFDLPYIMSRIEGNPLKFIIFIDDLSFNKNDDCFSMLKAVLEGSASGKASNAVIVATSNRRHIVKESFAERQGTDDVHRADTMQELMSLSDRFGLVVYFSKPNKALYLEIVHQLAQRADLNIPSDELDLKAEAFALSKGSRSPRAAEQFINSLI